MFFDKKNPLDMGAISQYLLFYIIVNSILFRELSWSMVMIINVLITGQLYWMLDMN